MSEPGAKGRAQEETDFARQVEEKAARKLKAQQRTNHTIWSGLGMMGLVGWSVAIPTLLGTALGLWIDKKYATDRSWTLVLLAAGLGLGCLNAWHWVAKENRAIHEQENGDHE